MINLIDWVLNNSYVARVGEEAMAFFGNLLVAVLTCWTLLFVAVNVFGFVTTWSTFRWVVFALAIVLHACGWFRPWSKS